MNHNRSSVSPNKVTLKAFDTWDLERSLAIHIIPSVREIRYIVIIAVLAHTEAFPMFFNIAKNEKDSG